MWIIILIFTTASATTIASIPTTFLTKFWTTTFTYITNGSTIPSWRTGTTSSSSTLTSPLIEILWIVGTIQLASTSTSTNVLPYTTLPWTAWTTKSCSSRLPITSFIEGQSATMSIVQWTMKWIGWIVLMLFSWTSIVHPYGTSITSVRTLLFSITNTATTTALSTAMSIGTIPTSFCPTTFVSTF